MKTYEVNLILIFGRKVTKLVQCATRDEAAAIARASVGVASQVLNVSL